MERLGLGFETLHANHPGPDHAVHLQHGPDRPPRRYAGFGSQLTALAGMCGLTGNPAGRRCCFTGLISTSSPPPWARPRCWPRWRNAGAPGKAATSMSRNTNAACCFWPVPCSRITTRARSPRAPATPTRMLRRMARGRAAAAAGWPCRAGRQSEFAALCTVIGRTDLARDPALATRRAPGRRDAHAGPTAIGDWAARIRRMPAQPKVCSAHGIHAHAVSTVADLFTDPQLADPRPMAAPAARRLQAKWFALSRLRSVRDPRRNHHRGAAAGRAQPARVRRTARPRPATPRGAAAHGALD